MRQLAGCMSGLSTLMDSFPMKSVQAVVQKKFITKNMMLFSARRKTNGLRQDAMIQNVNIAEPGLTSHFLSNFGCNFIP